MLPFNVPIGNWRFWTDNLIESSERQYLNQDLTWGACIEGTRPLPHDFQLSIDIYNEWCKYAYDWNTIFELLNSIDAQLIDAIDAQARVHYDDSPTSSIKAAAFEYDQSHPNFRENSDTDTIETASPGDDLTEGFDPIENPDSPTH
jgi:hypothetical protein